MTKEYRDPQGRPINQFGTPLGAPVGPPPDQAAPQPPQPSYPTFPPPPTAYAGAPTAGPMGPPPPYAPPPYVGYAPPRPGISTGAKVALALGGAVAGIVVLGILAAIAIPVFLNQRARAEAEHISVSLPATVAGYQRLTGAADASVQNLVAGLPTEAGSQGAVYGSTRPFVVVIVGHHLMLSGDRSNYLNAVARSERNEGVVQTRVDAGPLGGEMRCGAAADGTRTDCAFADAGAFGVIDVALIGPRAQALVLQVRAEVEHRH